MLHVNVGPPGFISSFLLSVTDLQRDRHAAAVGDDLADANRHRLLQEQAHLPDSAQHLQDQGHASIIAFYVGCSDSVKPRGVELNIL